MVAILLESIVFLTMLGALLAVVLFAIVRWTPIGTRLRQVANRRAIEARQLTRCPIHGDQPESSLVRLKTGGVICSLCFKEAVEDVERQ